MNGFNDNYLSGQTITGQSPLEEAVQDVISGGLQSDLNMNGKRIYGIPTTAITDNEAMSRKETYDLFVQSAGGVSSIVNLAVQNSAIPLSKDLNFLQANDNPGNYKVLVETPLSTANSKQVANKQYVDTSVSNEANIRSSADTTLLNALNLEISARQTADTNLQTQITQEVQNRQTADTALQTSINLKANQSTTYTKSETDTQISNAITTGVQLSNVVVDTELNMGFQKIIGLGTPEYPQDATTKEYTDAADQNLQTQINNRATFSYVDGKKLNDFSANGDINIGTNHIYEGSVGSFNTQLATQSYVLTSDNNVRLYAGTVAGNAETSAIASAKSYTDSVGSGLEWQIQQKRSITDSYSKTDVYTKTEVDSKIPTVDGTQIKNSTAKSKVVCAGDNAIDLYANNVKVGTIYQPLGQATTPLGIQSTDKIQLQSALSSISAYGSKPIDTSAGVLNTHGLYVTGIDSSSANVQATVNCGTANSANIYLTAGHIGATKFANVSSDSGLYLSGGLQPMSVDPTINCLSAAQKTAQSSVLGIQFTDKTGYATNTAITESNQFASKSYCDSKSGGTTNQSLAQIATANPSTTSITASSQKITNVLDPTLAQDAATKNYVDGRTVSQSLAQIASANASTTSITASSQRITNVALCTAASDAANKSYVDSKTTVTAQYQEACAIYFSGNPAVSNYFTQTQFKQLVQTSASQYITYNNNGQVTIQPGYYKMFLSTTGLSTASSNVQIQIRNVTTNSAIMTSLYSSTMTTANFSMAQAIGASNTNNDSHANGQCLMFLTGTALTLGLYLSVLQSTADSTTWIIERISDSQYVLAANAVATSNLLVDSDIDLATANKRIKTSNPVNPTDAVNLQYFQTNGVGGTPTQIISADSTSSLIAGTNSLTANQILSMSSKKITNLALCTSSNDAANKSYVDSQIATVSGSGTQISDGTSTLYFTQESLRLKQNGQALSLFQFDAPSNKMTISPLNFDYFSNSTFQYIFRESINGQQRRKPLYLADNDFYIDQNSFGYSSLLYLGSNHSNINSLTINDINKNISINTKILDITGNPAGSFFVSNFLNMQVDDVQNVKVNNSTIYLDANSRIRQNYPADAFGALEFPALEIFGNYLGTDEWVAVFHNRIRATAFDVYTPISMRKYKKDIELPDFTGFENIHFYDYRFNKDVVENEDLRINLPNEVQQGFILDEVPEKYHLETAYGNDIKTVNYTKLQNHLISWLVEERRAMRSQLDSLEQRLAALESRTEVRTV